ncbi:MAG: protease complex subunit PrcB family protein [Thiohalomonadales bacterium]
MKCTALFSAILYGILPISACVAQQSNLQPMLTEVIFAGQQCNLSESSGVIWINNPQRLEAVLKQTNSHMVAGNPPRAPAVDFVKNAVVAVSMGQQRTGGYALEISKSPLQIENGSATLKLNYRQPGKGMMTIQMITSPCILIIVPRGDYKIFRAVTLTGKNIASTTVE